MNIWFFGPVRKAHANVPDSPPAAEEAKRGWRDATPGETLSFVWELSKGMRWRLWANFLLLAAAQAMLAPAWALLRALYGAYETPVWIFLPILAQVATVSVIGLAMAAGRRRAAQPLGLELHRRARIRIVNHLRRISFTTRTRLNAKILTEAEVEGPLAFQYFVTGAGAFVLTAGSTIIVGLIAALAINVRVSLVALGLAAVGGLVLGAIGRTWRRLMSSFHAVVEELSTHIGTTGSPGGVELDLTLPRSETRRGAAERGSAVTRSVREYFRTSRRQNLAADAVSRLLPPLILGVCYLAGERPPLADAIVIVTIATNVLGPVVTLVFNLEELVKQWQQGARAAGIVEAIPADLPAGVPPARPPADGHVLIKKAVFRHKGQRQPVLRVRRLEIPAGAFVALLGPNAAGKSTLLRLLNAILTRADCEPDDGWQIEIGGVDVTASSSDQRARFIVSLSQISAAYDGTVRTNLEIMTRGYGLDAQTVARVIEQAARLSCFNEVIRRLAKGWDEPIRNDTLTSSGGEWQRFRIAMGFARLLAAQAAVKVKLLLLDEPMTGLDAATNRKILENVDALRAQLGFTVIMVTHTNERFSPLVTHVVFMAKGRIIESGTAEQVRSRPGPFRRELEDLHAQLGRLPPTTHP